jgi:hypothetical protein
MNLSTAIFLVNNHCRAISVAYEWCDKDGKAANGAVVKTDVFKTLDPDIRKGDLVIGETTTRHNLCVYKVVETDVEIDLERSDYIPWIVGVVDGSPLSKLRAMEQEMKSKIQEKDKQRKRAELAETMMKDYGEVVRNLAIANTGVKAIDPPAS